MMGDSPPYSNSSTSSSGHVSPRNNFHPVMDVDNGQLEAQLALQFAPGNMSPAEPMTPENNVSPVSQEMSDSAQSSDRASSTVPSPDQSISPPDVGQSSSTSLVISSLPAAKTRKIDADDVWNGGNPPPILLPQTWIREPQPPPAVEEQDPEKRALNELITFLTREAEINFGRYPCCQMKLGDRFRRIEEVADWVVQAGNTHKDMRYVSGNTKRTHYPKWDDKEDVWNRSILEREYYCRFGEKIFGYDQVPKCPARFNVSIREKNTPDEHFVVVEVNNLHENHPDPATGRIPGFDYSKIKIELGTVCSYRDTEEFLEDVKARSRKRYLYDQYVDAYVPREKFTTKPPPDPRDPKVLFPRHNPYHYSKFNAVTGQLVIPVEWLPVGWMDKNRNLTQEQIDIWNRKQQAHFDEVMMTWENWEKRMMAMQLQQLIRNRDACDSQSNLLAARRHSEQQVRENEKKTVEKSLAGGSFGTGFRPLNPVGRSRRRYSGIEECTPDEEAFSSSRISPIYIPKPPCSPEPLGDIHVRRPLRLTGIKRSMPVIPIKQALERMVEKRRSSEDDNLPTDLPDIGSSYGTVDF